MLQGLLQIFLTVGIVMLLAPRLGRYIAQVFLGETTRLDRVLVPLEQKIFQGLKIRPEAMDAGQYIRAVLYSNLVMGIWVYGLLIFQGILPFNPQQLT
ncbi:MAG: potassium-transporting ATPase subunit KdpA, partial [Microcystaceae cyanobacterium]